MKVIYLLTLFSMSEPYTADLAKIEVKTFTLNTQAACVRGGMGWLQGAKAAGKRAYYCRPIKIHTQPPSKTPAKKKGWQV